MEENTRSQSDCNRHPYSAFLSHNCYPCQGCEWEWPTKLCFIGTFPVFGSFDTNSYAPLVWSYLQLTSGSRQNVISRNTISIYQSSCQTDHKTREVGCPSDGRCYDVVDSVEPTDSVWPPSKLWNLGPRCFRNQEGQSCRAQNDSYYSYFNLFHWSCWLSYTFYIFLSFLIQFNKDTQHTLLAVAFPDPHKQANPTSISHICTAS